MAHVLEHGVAKPFDTECPFYCLLEFEQLSEHTGERAMEIFEHCVEQGWVLDGVMSQSLSQLEQLWQLRERISESIAPHTPYKNDISVTVSKVPDFVEDVDKVVQEAYPDFEIVWFGHIGDGNMHLNILKPADLPKEDFFRQCGDVSKWVFEIVQKYDGSISAEHGVGMTKKPYLSYSRGEEEIAYMKAVKAVFDPNNVMNPGKLFDV
jgi:FAD/FMN-containing dehydrogenase